VLWRRQSWQPDPFPEISPEEVTAALFDRAVNDNLFIKALSDSFIHLNSGVRSGSEFICRLIFSGITSSSGWPPSAEVQVGGR